MKNGKKDKDRISAATAIWDRCYGRPGQAIRINHNQPVDHTAIMAALADQARGVLIDSDEDGVQRLVVTPSQQLPEAIPIEVESSQLDDGNGA
ncbi:hypothetical protein SDC9_205622 [bioreactor metagenome]|uniref:Uncharacterized protein n=2 Tax=root TaxID=1 RepID=A0A645J3A7_9ZZZZ